MDNFVLPPPLGHGARIAVLAPSGVVQQQAVRDGLDLLEQAGFCPVLWGDVFAQEDYLAGSDERRAAALQSALDDPSIAAIWTARGGFGSAALLDQLDAHVLRRQPKWLIGFSDITALHLLWQRMGLMSLHGPNITGLAEKTTACRDKVFSLLRAGPSLEHHTLQELGNDSPSAAALELLGVHQLAGTLWGGNLTVLASLAGTAYLQPPPGPSMLVVEDIAEAPYRVHRALLQLRQSGNLHQVCAVIGGQFTPPRSGSWPMARYEDALQRVLAPMKIPLFMGLAFGHEPDALPLLLGAQGRLARHAQRYTLEVCPS